MKKHPNEIARKTWSILPAAFMIIICLLIGYSGYAQKATNASSSATQNQMEDEYKQTSILMKQLYYQNPQDKELSQVLRMMDMVNNPHNYPSITATEIEVMKTKIQTAMEDVNKVDLLMKNNNISYESAKAQVATESSSKNEQKVIRRYADGRTMPDEPSQK